MFPFWDSVVAPVLETANARTIVEIGALRGENTERMIRRLGADVVLHVIDPLPAFDPLEHEARFGGQYVFHEDLSLNVLPHLEPMDAAIIDGDHNWFTVINECRELAKVARAAGAPLPVMVFHDVAWPYGRRDLYYEPSQIPEEFRQDYARQGIRRHRSELAPRGGMNRELANALVEGGPRNGVMTAVEDFIAEHDRPLRLVTLPLYFGLAIVVEEEFLTAHPELTRLLDHLESPAGLTGLIELGEEIRTDEAVWNQLVFTHHTGQIDALAEQYLALLKASVLGETGIENELRLGYIEENLRTGRVADPEILRDPVRGLQGAVQRLDAAGHSGARGADTGAPVWFRPTSMGRHRLEQLEQQLDVLREEGVPGDFGDCGSGRGGAAAFLRGYLEAHRLTDPTVWVADPLLGGGPSPEAGNRLSGAARGFPALTADLNIVRDTIDRLGLLDDRVRFAQGSTSATLAAGTIEKIALLRIGTGVDDPDAIIEAAGPHLSPGARIVVEDGESWRVDEPAPAGAVEPSAVSPHPPFPARVTGTVDLSVVVVFYNMAREAPRTLHSLSSAYQRHTDGRSIEIIVVDNGSSPEQRLSEEMVRSFGPEFRLVALGDEATPSPTTAVNRGLREARGELIGIMVDGAHVVSPGVFHNVFTAQEAYGPSAVAIQQWYVGPGQQSSVMLEGYDTEAEDRLFESIEWPMDGYRLFDISSFIGDRDWFDGVAESNCVFAPRSLLDAVGGFDDAFDEPGGSFSNLDFYDRVAGDPRVELVSVLGEGSFHQVHGGTTTNQPSADERNARIRAYVEKYEGLRGKPYKGPRRLIHYVGTLRAGAKRTKARRRTAASFIEAGRAGASGGPTEAFPMPTDTKAEFTEAYWNSLNWQKVSWLDQPVPLPAADLIAYQEAVVRSRPDLIIDVGTGDGGRAFYLATICDLLGHGQVISIDNQRNPDRPTHARLRQIDAAATAPETIEEVRTAVGDGRAMLFLGSRARPPRTLAEFAAYEDLVAVGAYVVVEMTALNGHPIWAEYGPGPFEAVVRITNEHRDFIIDPELEIHGMTFSPGGFLKRAR